MVGLIDVVDIIKLFIILQKHYLPENYTGEMIYARFYRNLIEKSRMDQYLTRDKNNIVLSRYFN
jgi:hypothetical protein